jgi:hypothetical protein
VGHYVRAPSWRRTSGPLAPPRVAKTLDLSSWHLLPRLPSWRDHSRGLQAAGYRLGAHRCGAGRTHRNRRGPRLRRQPWPLAHWVTALIKEAACRRRPLCLAVIVRDSHDHGGIAENPRRRRTSAHAGRGRPAASGVSVPQPKASSCVALSTPTLSSIDGSDGFSFRSGFAPVTLNQAAPLRPQGLQNKLLDRRGRRLRLR